MVRKLETGGILVGTQATFAGLVARKLLNLSDLSLIVADNVHASIGPGQDLDSILQAYRLVFSTAFSLLELRLPYEPLCPSVGPS